MIDTANVNNTDALRLEYFDWRRVSLSQNSELVYLDMEGNSYHDTAKNIRRYGSIKLSVKYLAASSRESIYIVYRAHCR